MRLSRLLLLAFGPFTDTVLDFDSGPANLHLIYGPNEAGKSSALRAMTDLRFGIPARSQDDFIHPFKQMRIGGVFMDGSGQAIGVVRHKGRGATLTRFDSGTGQPDLGLAVTRELEVALTGGLQRGEFETLFGLNHFRLREGGDLLLKGEGELGSALFEASAGTLGIAAILAGLDNDAKKLYNPHRAAKSSINEAWRQYEEQKQNLRQTQTKPNDWQCLQRAHEAAKARLAELEQGLETQRRRENELIELRNVEPLLRGHDRVLAELQGYADIPDLPENAVQLRMQAEGELLSNRQIIAKAKRELGECAERLATLTIEPALLKHSQAIERLSSGLEPAVRSRLEIRRQHLVIEKMQTDIAAATARIGLVAGELEDILPSAGDRASLDHHLQEIGTLRVMLDAYRKQAAKAEEALQQHFEETPALPEQSNCQALNLALREAQGLGDVSRNKTEMGRRLRNLASQLAQSLSDMNIATVESLQSVQPLLENEITDTRRALSDIDNEMLRLRNDAARLRRELEEQHVRKRLFQAEGEVVTAETLRLARELRDSLWQQVRRAYVDKQAALTERETSLPDAFEASQGKADRQADILRTDAKRAAGFEECIAVIVQKEKHLQEIAKELQDMAARSQAVQSDWSQRLASTGLPGLQPDSLREWQVFRLNALELHDRLAMQQAELELAAAEAEEAASALSAALRAVDCKPAGSVNSKDLPALIEQAVQWEKSATLAQGQHKERIKSIRRQQKEKEEACKGIAVTEASLRHHQDGLLQWHGRLRLKPDSPPAAVKARLEELDAIERQIVQLGDALAHKAQHQAVIDDLEAQSRQLADLLGEPHSGQVDDFIDRLRQRLNSSKEQAQQRKSLLSDQARSEKELGLAQTGLDAQTDRLERLCLAAHVGSTGQLPEREQAATLKRLARDKLLQLRQQLEQASVRDEQTLRQRLAGLDAVAIDSERERCKTEIARLEQEQAAARQQEEQARRELETIDTSDSAAKARESMESAAARWRTALLPWARLRLAHALLAEALNRFRERAQAPMVASASAYFSLMTGGRYEKLLAEEQEGKPVLRALRTDGARIGVEAMSEGTADQLYLALRLAALELRRDSHPQMPLVLDDVLVTSDDQRAANILRALAHFAQGGQVMLFTHHQHLIELAKMALGGDELAFHTF